MKENVPEQMKNFNPNIQESTNTTQYNQRDQYKSLRKYKGVYEGVKQKKMFTFKDKLY